jgi:hypothetical protein
LERGAVRRNLRGVTRSVVLVGLIAALALGASASARGSASGRAAGCGSDQGHTLARSDSARVYTRGGTVFGCAIPNGTVYKLGSASVCNGHGRAAPVAVAGRLVAYGLETCGIDTGSAVVIVRRLTDGKRLRDDPSRTGPAGPESYDAVDSLVLAPSGADAWITVTSSIVSHQNATEVHEHGRNGFALLDSGSGVNPGSLRLKRSKLTWRHSGLLRSATLR